MTSQRIQQLLDRATHHSRLQAGPLPFVEPIPDSDETVRRQLDHAERARFEHAALFEEGFTLIELMVVVAIIGILAAIAIPAYQEYVVRAQVMEGVTLAGGVKTSVAEFYASSGSFPADLKAIGMDPANPPTGQYTKSVTVKDGVIIMTYGVNASDAITKLGSPTLAIAPAVTTGGQLVWVCGNAAAPGTATLAGDPAASTTIQPKYLPGTCRS